MNLWRPLVNQPSTYDILKEKNTNKMERAFLSRYPPPNSPKVVINFPLVYKKLCCKGELYMASG